MKYVLAILFFLFSYPALASVGYQECLEEDAPFSATQAGVANNQPTRAVGPFPEETIGIKACPPGNRPSISLTERTTSPSRQNYDKNSREEAIAE